MMSLAVAQPMALWGLLTIGIPILIHSLKRAQPRAQPLATYQFLLEQGQKTRLLWQLNQPWLMVLRILLLTILVLALSQIKIVSSSSLSDAETVLLIDPAFRRDPAALQALLKTNALTQHDRRYWLDERDGLGSQVIAAGSKSNFDPGQLWLAILALDQKLPPQSAFAILLAQPLSLAELSDYTWPLQRSMKWFIAQPGAGRQTPVYPTLTDGPLHLYWSETGWPQSLREQLKRVEAWSWQVSSFAELDDFRSSSVLAPELVFLGAQSEDLKKPELLALIEAGGRVFASQPMPQLENQSAKYQTVWSEPDIGRMLAVRRGQGLVFVPDRDDFWLRLASKPERLPVLLYQCLGESVWLDAPLPPGQWPELVQGQLSHLSRAPEQFHWSLASVFWLLAFCLLIAERIWVLRGGGHAN